MSKERQQRKTQEGMMRKEEHEKWMIDSLSLHPRRQKHIILLFCEFTFILRSLTENKLACTDSMPLNREQFVTWRVYIYSENHFFVSTIAYVTPLCFSILVKLKITYVKMLFQIQRADSLELFTKRIKPMYNRYQNLLE